MNAFTIYRNDELGGGPAKLDRHQLRIEQQRTLATPRRNYGLAARALFGLLDLVYGRARTLSKFKVLEVVARVPYQAWEHVGYVAVTHRYSRPTLPGASSSGCTRAGTSRTTSSGTC